jgi:alkanesulfonate monooxygenase SsuD/methylene tetrahydromethanopterin reductase-like flavin-dependent oxidoreductase (luciferase family)
LKFGVTLPSVRVGDDPNTLVELGVLAEESGWDGVFIWDGLYYGNYATEPFHDAWIALAAIAARTKRIRIGTMVTALARRKPWDVARQAVTLDRLSKGRFILSVALGAEDEGGFGKVGEPADRKSKAEKLSESLEILTGLWSGKPFSYSGKHYKIEEMAFLPKPLQEPRIPIWVVAAWPKRKSMERAIRYDGIIPTKMLPNGEFDDMTVQDISEMREFINARRLGENSVYDIEMAGETPGEDREKANSIVRPLAGAGVTWWLEAVFGTPETEGGIGGMRKRIKQGPPAV